jgi:hypothetical protein
MSKNLFDKSESNSVSQSPEGRKDALFEAENHKLKGLGGWLLLVGLGVLLAPINLTIGLLSSTSSMFNDGTWELLTNPTSESYIPYFSALIIFEILAGLILTLISIYMMYLFFSKHYLFPKIFISFYLASLIFVLFDSWVIAVIFNTPIFDADNARELGRQLIIILIWIPYMLVSKRVKITFVEHKPQPNR